MTLTIVILPNSNKTILHQALILSILLFTKHHQVWSIGVVQSCAYTELVVCDVGYFPITIIAHNISRYDIYHDMIYITIYKLITHFVYLH